MSRYNTITEGATLTDVSTDGGHNYYGMLRRDGSWVIMRETTDEDEYRFAIGNGNASTYQTNWTDRTSLTYNYANAFGN